MRCVTLGGNGGGAAGTGISIGAVEITGAAGKVVCAASTGLAFVLVVLVAKSGNGSVSLAGFTAGVAATRAAAGSGAFDGGVKATGRGAGKGASAGVGGFGFTTGGSGTCVSGTAVLPAVGCVSTDWIERTEGSTAAGSGGTPSPVRRSLTGAVADAEGIAAFGMVAIGGSAGDCHASIPLGFVTDGTTAGAAGATTGAGFATGGLMIGAGNGSGFSCVSGWGEGNGLMAGTRSVAGNGAGSCGLTAAGAACTGTIDGRGTIAGAAAGFTTADSGTGIFFGGGGGGKCIGDGAGAADAVSGTGAGGDTDGDSLGCSTGTWRSGWTIAGVGAGVGAGTGVVCRVRAVRTGARGATRAGAGAIGAIAMGS